MVKNNFNQYSLPSGPGGTDRSRKNTLEFLLSQAVNMPAPPPSGSIKEFKLRQSRIGYNDILGISSRALNGLPSNDGEKLISMSNRLFPSPTNRKGQEWLQHVQTALNVWIREGTVEAGETLRLMSLMARRFHQAGDRERVKTIMATISCHLQNIQFKQKEPIDLDIISFMVVVGRETGERLDLKVMWGLLKEKRLDIGLIAGVISRTAEEASLPQALTIGERATVYTQNGDLLAVMVTLNEKLKDKVVVGKWRKLREQAVKSREAYPVSRSRMDLP